MSFADAIFIIIVAVVIYGFVRVTGLAKQDFWKPFLKKKEQPGEQAEEQPEVQSEEQS